MFKFLLLAIPLAAVIACDAPGTGPVASDIRVLPGTTTSSEIVIIPHSTSPNGLAAVMPTSSEVQFRAEVHVGSSLMPKSRVEWSSTIPAYATVDSTGLVRSAATYADCNWAAPGYCTTYIVAASQGLADSMWVVVTPRLAITVQPDSLKLAVGDSAEVFVSATIGGEPFDCHLRTVADPSRVQFHMRDGRRYVRGVAPSSTAVIFVADNRICAGGHGDVHVTVVGP